MKDEFDELLEELNLENFGEDFEVKPAKYDVYLYNYDANQNIMDETALVASCADPDLAIKRAKELSEDMEALKRLAASDAHFVSVEVETTVERDDCVENAGTLFATSIQLK